MPPAPTHGVRVGCSLSTLYSQFEASWEPGWFVFLLGWTPSPSFPSSARKCDFGGLWGVGFPLGVSGPFEQPAFLTATQ